VIYESIFDPSGFVMVIPGVTSVISNPSGLVLGVTSVVSETVFDPSGFVVVVVCVVVTVPSGPRVFVVTSDAVGVTGMAVAEGELMDGSSPGLVCKLIVAAPAPAHKKEAMMHMIPAVSMLQSSSLVQIFEARAT
jgi:hypothetical protein